MCGGVSSGKVDTSYQDYSIQQAEAAKAAEAARQKRVGFGMDQIKSLYEGGLTQDVVDATKYRPKAQYFLEDGTVWKPKTSPAKSAAPAASTGGKQYYTTDANGNRQVIQQTPGKKRAESDVVGGSTASRGRVQSPEAQFAAMLGKLKTLAPKQRTAGIAPILAEREQAQRDFFIPQLNKEFRNTSDQLTYALSRAGQGVSTTANKKRADLKEGYGLERAGIESKIAADIASTKGAYQNQRQALEAQLRSSGDATTATNAALSNIDTYAKDSPEFSPLGSVLAGFAQNIGMGMNGYGVGKVQQTARGGSGSTVNRNLSKVVS